MLIIDASWLIQLDSWKKGFSLVPWQFPLPAQYSREMTGNQLIPCVDFAATRALDLYCIYCFEWHHIYRAWQVLKLPVYPWTRYSFFETMLLTNLEMDRARAKMCSVVILIWTLLLLSRQSENQIGSLDNFTLKHHHIRNKMHLINIFRMWPPFTRCHTEKIRSISCLTIASK